MHQLRLHQVHQIPFSSLSLDFLLHLECNIILGTRDQIANIRCIIEKAREFQKKRKWQSTPVLLPGKSHGQRSLVGYSPWGRKESDMTERLHFQFIILLGLVNIFIFYICLIFYFINALYKDVDGNLAS